MQYYKLLLWQMPQQKNKILDNIFRQHILITFDHTALKVSSRAYTHTEQLTDTLYPLDILTYQQFTGVGSPFQESHQAREGQRAPVSTHSYPTL